MTCREENGEVHPQFSPLINGAIHSLAQAQKKYFRLDERKDEQKILKSLPITRALHRSLSFMIGGIVVGSVEAS